MKPSYNSIRSIIRGEASLPNTESPLPCVAVVCGDSSFNDDDCIVTTFSADSSASSVEPVIANRVGDSSPKALPLLRVAHFDSI